MCVFSLCDCVICSACSSNSAECNSTTTTVAECLRKQFSMYVHTTSFDNRDLERRTFSKSPFVPARSLRGNWSDGRLLAVFKQRILYCQTSSTGLDPHRFRAMAPSAYKAVVHTCIHSTRGNEDVCLEPSPLASLSRLAALLTEEQRREERSSADPRPASSFKPCWPKSPKR